MKIMPLYKVTVKSLKIGPIARIEPGMSVEIASTSFVNPILANRGQEVQDAFMRIYGIDLRRLGALNLGYLTCVRIR